MLAHSLDMPTLTTAGSITFVSKALHESTVVRLERCSRLENLTARVTVRIQRMFLAGEYSPCHPLFILQNTVKQLHVLHEPINCAFSKLIF